MNTLIHACHNILYYEPYITLAEKLNEYTGGGKMIYSSNSGAEANEGAMKLAKYATGRPVATSMKNAFHGRTMACATITTSNAAYRKSYEPMMPSVYFAEYPNLFRTPYKLVDGKCPKEYMAQFDDIFQKIVAPSMVAAFQRNGAYCIDSETGAETLRNCAFPYGSPNKDFAGASMEQITEMTGLPIPAGTKAIACRIKGYAENDVLSKEKLFPVLAMSLYGQWEEAVEIAWANPAMEGMGHSCVIHSNTAAHIEYVPTKINVSRYAVNQAGGAPDNGLNPTTMLGCGIWGNSSISENLWYYHLMNVSRSSYRLTDAKIPTGEEIWAG